MTLDVAKMQVSNKQAKSNELLSSAHSPHPHRSLSLSLSLYPSLSLSDLQPLLYLCQDT